MNNLPDAWNKLIAAIPSPDVFLMNWSTWCQTRLMLKASGIPIHYTRVGKHRWERKVVGVKILIDPFIKTEDIFSLTQPPGALFKIQSIQVRKYTL